MDEEKKNFFHPQIFHIDEKFNLNFFIHMNSLFLLSSLKFNLTQNEIHWFSGETMLEKRKVVENLDKRDKEKDFSLVFSYRFILLFSRFNWMYVE